MPSSEEHLLLAVKYAKDAKQLQTNQLYKQTLDNVVAAAEKEAYEIDLTGENAGQAAISSLLKIRIAKKFKAEMAGGIERAIKAEEALKKRDKPE